MKKRDQPESRLWNALLGVHFLLYAACWMLALNYLSHLNISDSAFHTYTMGILVALGWTPLLMLHVGIHYHAAGRRSANEREIYREGYADAMQQFAVRAYETRHLQMEPTEDDEELFELQEKRKRHER